MKSIIRTFFLTNSFFSELQKKIETYADFRVAFLHDENGGKLWEEDLFLNLYDFWCLRRDGFLLKMYKTKNALLKKIIRKKVRGNKELSTYKVLLGVIAKREEQFNPMDYLNKDWKEYFHILKEWKKVCGKDFLEQYPHLREPKRHRKSKKICLYN